ncbi:methyl-accepting chemotaxis protein [Methylophilus aquaticus]|uniref:Methyl-accepting chemotaxis protein n=1 Tax=Methylophilus aquaticus TaxID=1971610 RepID=A0ABT9JRZ6_9PROT|nr:methyl-accepting chemotaxis protein [Methylophilus aquaticus]MDP8567345.1 methyl-accepting chemotaxis protein [Methylophilus aquaticus]
MHYQYESTADTEYMMDENDANLHQLCESVLPLWAGQVEAAKTLTNTSIEGLSAKFASLSQSIRHVTSQGQNQSTEQLISLLQDSQQQLTTVIDLLKNSIEEKKALLKAITELSANAKTLGNMADTVSRISKETGMVAVNAAIEAARVGERGRGFAVVADAVKRLSSDAGRTGDHISETVLGVSQAIKTVTDISKEFEKKDAQTLKDAEQVVNTVVEKFGSAANAVVNTSQQMLTESTHVANEIDQVLYALQFQDRVSQMLTHVHQDISKLSTKMHEEDGLGDVDEWLDSLKSSYTMREQTHIHEQKTMRHSQPRSNTSKPQAETAPSSDDGEITFF